MSLPTKCSWSAHNKIHQRMSPYICPECGTQFYTFDYFKRHVLQTCYHNRKTMMNVCPYCPTLDKFTADRQQVTRHQLFIPSQANKPISCRYFFTLQTSIVMFTWNVVNAPLHMVIKQNSLLTGLKSIQRMKMLKLKKFTESRLDQNFCFSQIKNL